MGVFELGGASKCAESVTDAGQCRGHTQRSFILPPCPLSYNSIDQSQSRFYVICVLITQKTLAAGYFWQSVTDVWTTHSEL